MYFCLQITQFDIILSLNGYHDIQLDLKNYYILILHRMESDNSYILRLLFQNHINLKIHILNF
jgi:hypothetical protein